MKNQKIYTHLKREVNNLSNNPKYLKCLNTKTNDSYAALKLDNSFTVIKSNNNLLYLIYSNENKSIISYNLIENQKLNEIKNAHDNYITNFRHYLDSINKRTLIISISSEDNNLKLWNIYNWECLLNITNVNKQGYLISACFLNYNNQIYILTSNSHYEKSNEIKVYDLKGNKIKEIKYSNENTVFIDTYYDKKLNNYYIITGNFGFIKKYNYNQNKNNHKYCDGNNCFHDSILINDNDKDIIKLIESCQDGNIRIWNYRSGSLLTKIKIDNKDLCGICLWDNDHLFISCDNRLELVNINNNLKIKKFFGHKSDVATLKIINHPKYEKCLISQGFWYDSIILWIKK